MTSEAALEGLKEHQRQRSAMKNVSVVAAIESLRNAEAVITIASVARVAGVSREFIHSHTDLHQAVLKAAEQARNAVATKVENNRHGGLDKGTRADRITLLGQISKQRERLSTQARKLAELESQRQRWLGSQLIAFDESSPEVVSELLITNERLMTDKATLTSAVTDLRRQNEILRTELSAARQALREELTRPSSPDTAVVIPFGEPRS